MRTYLLLYLTFVATLVAVMVAWPTQPKQDTLIIPIAVPAPGHAIIPVPQNRRFYCYRNGQTFECWCDEWIRYPICRRWHWHPRETADRP